MHHHVVNLDVAALVGPSVRAADGQPVAVSAEGEGRTGPGIVQHDVLPHDVPVAGPVVVPVHPDVGLGDVVGGVAGEVLVGVVEALLGDLL